MAGYRRFADYYDSLTANVSYKERAAYFDRIFKTFAPGAEAGILLDLACGTGSLAVELAALGYDVIGVDGSAEMLSVAMQKLPEAEGPPNPLFLCQEMSRLNLFGTVQFAVSALDSLNHILSRRTLGKVLARVSLFMDPGGIFVFDVNTPYKHREVLGDNTFVSENDRVFCVWQYSYQPEDDRVDIQLDFFGKEHSETDGEIYLRESEQFAERAYSHETLAELIADAGLELLACYEGDTLAPVGERTQRAVYVTRKR